MVGKKKREAAETAVAMEEEAFPRGGGQGLAPVVQRQLERVSAWAGSREVPPGLHLS